LLHKRAIAGQRGWEKLLGQIRFFLANPLQRTQVDQDVDQCVLIGDRWLTPQMGPLNP
jgi:hypothetical protein